MFADPKDLKIQEQVVNLYLSGKMPLEIQRELNFKNFQPIFNLLKKKGLYERRETRYHRKFEINQEFFKVIDTEEKAYILGFIVADGNVSDVNHRCTIQIHRQDRDVLEKIAEAFDNKIEVKDITHGGFPHCKLSLNSKSMMQDLYNKGLLPRKSKTMTGEIYTYIPDNLKKHFLRGYFEGDGHVTLGAKYSSGTKYVIDIIGTKEFLEATFGTYFKTNCKLNAYKSCDMFSWKTASKKGVLDFLHEIYDGSTIYMNRKFNKFKEFIDQECAHLKLGELLEP